MPKREPERSCIVTRESGSASGLMRFVLSPDGAVVPDLRNRLPGRGAWVTPRAAILAEAIKRKSFSRAFKTPVQPPPDLVAAVDVALVRDLLGALSLAVKSAAVVAGFAKVDAALGAGGAAALIHSAEAAEDGKRKLAATLHRVSRDTMLTIPTFDDLRGDELDMAFGRVGVVHAALLAGAGSSGCLARWRRLRLFRGVDDDAAPPRGVTGRDAP